MNQFVSVTNKMSLEGKVENKEAALPTNERYFVFLVGINDYPDEIGKLRGCRRDLDLIESYLKQRIQLTDQPSLDLKKSISNPHLEINTYGNIYICRLQDASATYQNIIAGFEQFLTLAQPEDFVWFHFSGHGTEVKSAQEFADLRHEKDQCLVCVDSDLETNEYLLADKELAALLHHISSDEESPHILVTLDACHSGGGTRDQEILIRGLDHEQKEPLRSLSSYWNGYYVQEKSNMEGTEFHLQIPISPHWVITACQNHEKAAEGGIKQGGYFTQSLINSLNQHGEGISYADLQAQVHKKVRKKRYNQTPQFDIIGGVSAYKHFLSNRTEENPYLYEITFDNNDWFMEGGFIHGLKKPEKNAEEITVKIFELNAHQEKQIFAQANIKEIGFHRSLLSFDRESTKFSSEKRYVGELALFPAPTEYVAIKIESDEIDPKEVAFSFKNESEEIARLEAGNIQILFEPDQSKSSQIAINIQADLARIIDLKEGREIDYSYSWRNPQDIKTIYDHLLKIVNWRRFLALENHSSEKTGLTPKLELKFVGKNGDVIEFKKNEKKELEVTLNKNVFRPKHPRQKYAMIQPQISIDGKNETDHFYVYRYLLKPSYEIEIDEESQLLSDNLAFTSFYGGLDKWEDKSTIYMKIIISEEKIAHHSLTQSGIDLPERSSFGPAVEYDPLSRLKKWWVITRKITFLREVNP